MTTKDETVSDQAQRCRPGPEEPKPPSAMMEGYDEDLERVLEQARKRVKPKELILHCPQCQGQHVDLGKWRYVRVHKTHLCEHCGHLWRPFEFPTVGVLTLGPGT